MLQIKPKALKINVATKQSKWKIAYLCKYNTQFGEIEVNPRSLRKGFGQYDGQINSTFLGQYI